MLCSETSCAGLLRRNLSPHVLVNLLQTTTSRARSQRRVGGTRVTRLRWLDLYERSSLSLASLARQRGESTSPTEASHMLSPDLNLSGNWRGRSAHPHLIASYDHMFKEMLYRRQGQARWRLRFPVASQLHSLRLFDSMGTRLLNLMIPRLIKDMLSDSHFNPSHLSFEQYFMADKSQDGISRITRHAEYYIRDGNATFLVENTLFRVHTWFFERESQVFLDELEKAPQDGMSDSSPFRLKNITSDEFATLLWVWYSPKYRLDKKPKADWLLILDLSTRWHFREMRKLAIDYFQNLEMDPVEKIAIYNQYKIDNSLLLPEYKRLCTREGQMSTEDFEKVGLYTVLGIHHARERAIASAGRKMISHAIKRAAGKKPIFSRPIPADAGDELEKILIDVFKLNMRCGAGSRNGADNQVPSGDTDRQNAQSQGQSKSAQIVKPTQPTPKGTTGKSPGSVSSSHQ